MQAAHAGRKHQFEHLEKVFNEKYSKLQARIAEVKRKHSTAIDNALSLTTPSVPQASHRKPANRLF